MWAQEKDKEKPPWRQSRPLTNPRPVRYNSINYVGASPAHLLSDLCRTHNEGLTTTPNTMDLSPMNVSSAMGSTSPNKQQYLPGFLLGEQEQVTGVERPLTTKAVSPATSPQLSSILYRPDYNRGSKSKIEGPPTSGLFDDITNKRIATPDISSFMDSLSNSENNDNAGFWAVVYGFPPSQASQILSMFTLLGKVLEHSIPSCGNWMFIKYQSRMDLRKALAYNGRVIGGNIMIGVSERRGQCKAFHRDSKQVPIISPRVKPRELSLDTPYTPVIQRDTTTDPSYLSPGISCSPKSPRTPTSPRIRHLGLPRRETSITDPYGAPKKDTSVVSKAMDLLFGW